MVTYRIEPGESPVDTQFACPSCRAIHHIAGVMGERILSDSLKVRRS